MKWVAVGIIAVVLVLMVLVAIDRWGIFEDDRANPDSGTERVRQQARREENYDVSLLKKHKQLTLPAKLVVVSTGLLVLATGVFAYFTLKSGSPVEVPYANAVKASAIGTFGVLGGIWIKRSRDQMRGRIDVIYEDDSGDKEAADTIYFKPSESETDTQGRKIVYEHFTTRILSLFGRRKLVAHDRELRNERSLLSDLVAHRLPEHAVEVAPNRYVIRTQGRKVTTSPSSAADYDYRPPIELPYETYVNQREQIEKMKTRIESKDAVLGEVQSELKELRRRLEDREYRSFEDARGEIKEILEMAQSRNQTVQIREDSGANRRPETQGEIPDLEEDKNGGVESDA